MPKFARDDIMDEILTYFVIWMRTRIDVGTQLWWFLARPGSNGRANL
jgi:hypothetical protein